MSQVKGDSLMIFLDDNYKTMLYSQSHSLSISLTTKNVQYHSTDRNTYPEAVLGFWEMTAEILCSETELANMFDKMITRRKLVVMFGQATNYDGSENSDWHVGLGYRGKAIITNIEVTANTGDVATISAVFTGTTSLAYCSYDDPFDVESQQYSPSKQDPNIYFDHDYDEVDYDPTNLYDISDLYNPNGLTIRYIVLPYKGRLLQDIELIETRAVIIDEEIITNIQLNALKPGVYTILAIFDGDDTYNPSQVEYTIVIGPHGDEEEDNNPEPIDEPNDTQKFDPVFYFEYSSETKPENRNGRYKIQYLVNPANLDFNWVLPSGVYISDGWLYVPSMGTYIIQAVFAGNERYNPAQAEYELTITEPNEISEKEEVILRWIDAPQTYIFNNNGEYELPELYNPSGVPVTITSSNPDVTISGNTIIASENDIFTITASFDGNSYYYPASASFTSAIKIERVEITLEWSQSEVETTQVESGLYALPTLVNPLGVPVTYTITPSGSVSSGNLHTSGFGTYTIVASFAGNIYYLPATTTLTYIINEYIKSNIVLEWTESTIEVMQNEEGIYTLPALSNTSSVPVTYTITPSGTISNGNLHTSGFGTYTIVASFEGNFYYNPATTTLTYIVIEWIKIDPPIWWPINPLSISADTLTETTRPDDLGECYCTYIPYIENPSRLPLTYDDISVHEGWWYDSSISYLYISKYAIERFSAHNNDQETTTSAYFAGNWYYFSYTATLDIKVTQAACTYDMMYWDPSYSEQYERQWVQSPLNFNEMYLYTKYGMPEPEFGISSANSITVVKSDHPSDNTYQYKVNVLDAAPNRYTLTAYWTDNWRYEDNSVVATLDIIPRIDPVLQWVDSYMIPYPWYKNMYTSDNITYSAYYMPSIISTQNLTVKYDLRDGDYSLVSDRYSTNGDYRIIYDSNNESPRYFDRDESFTYLCAYVEDNYMYRAKTAYLEAMNVAYIYDIEWLDYVPYGSYTSSVIDNMLNLVIPYNQDENYTISLIDHGFGTDHYITYVPELKFSIAPNVMTENGLVPSEEGPLEVYGTQTQYRTNNGNTMVHITDSRWNAPYIHISFNTTYIGTMTVRARKRPYIDYSTMTYYTEKVTTMRLTIT